MDNLTYRKWLKLYQKAHGIKPPANNAKPLEVEVFLDKIDPILQESRRIVNKIEPMPKPLWTYKFYDETTWPSSSKFAYQHLLTGNASQGESHVI